MTKSEILKQINELTSVLMSDNTDNEKITLEINLIEMSNIEIPRQKEILGIS